MTWQKKLQEAIKSTDELADFIKLNKSELTNYPTKKASLF